MYCILFLLFFADLLRKQASILLSKKRPRRQLKDGEVPTLFQLCEDIVETLEPPVKRRRGRPRFEVIHQPKTLKVLCEQVLHQQLSPRRRGRKRKRDLLHSPLSLKELCKAVIDTNNPVRKKRLGRRRKPRNPPSLKELCEAVLNKKKQVRKKRVLIRSQRRKKFNKKLLGFADVPSVIKATYRDRLRLRKTVLNKTDVNLKPTKVYGKRNLEKSKVAIVEKPKKVVVEKPEPKEIEEKPKPIIIKKLAKSIKKVLADSDSDELIHREPPRKPIKTYRRKPKPNGNLIETKENVQVQNENVYRLQLHESRDIREKLQINIKFTDLLKDIQKVSLPSTLWKIKIILYNQQISQIVFSNKSSPERCVNIYRSTKYYDISFDKMFVHFLGAPLSVDCLQDLNCLLMIVHTIKEHDPMLQFVQK